jgi:hypothetical protein
LLPYLLYLPKWDIHDLGMTITILLVLDIVSGDYLVLSTSKTKDRSVVTGQDAEPSHYSIQPPNSFEEVLTCFITNVRTKAVMEEGFSSGLDISISWYRGQTNFMHERTRSRLYHGSLLSAPNLLNFYQ